MLEALILCRFDPLYGPKIFLKAPSNLDDEDVKKLPSLMELRSKGVFIHIFEKFKTANYFLKIPSKFARGGKEVFLISIVTDINSNLQLILARELLENFSKELLNIKDAYKAFDFESNNYKGDIKKLEEIHNLFFSFYKSLIPTIKTLDIAEHRYQALFEASKDAIFIIDNDLGFIIDVNEEAQKLIEQPREQIIGHSLSTIEIFNQSKLAQINFKDFNYENNELNFIEMRRFSGKLIYFEINSTNIKLGDQNLVQLILHDITEIKLAEKKLQEHNKNMGILNKVISVANNISSLPELVDNILNYIKGFLNLDGCCIYLIDEYTKIAKIIAHKGIMSDFIEKNEEININQNPFDLIFVKGDIIFNNNFPDVIHEFIKDTDFKQMAIFPLFSKLKIIGAISILLRESEQFSEESLDLFIALGLEIGTSIEKIKNEEFLRESENRSDFLLSQIPFSILRIFKDGAILDVKISSEMEKIFLPEDFLGKGIKDIFIEKSVEDLVQNISKAIKSQKFIIMKSNVTSKKNSLIFQVYIEPIETQEVLIFLQTIK
ncbi:MAG: PAS domain S-box protein [Promethearchaeota archaeon]